MPMLGQHTFVVSIANPLATDASIDATKQTAAGVALPLLELFLFPLGDLEFLGLLGLPGLLDDFLPGLLEVFLPGRIGSCRSSLSWLPSRAIVRKIALVAPLTSSPFPENALLLLSLTFG